ncbi:MAG: hypothetical protein A2096_04655 [Spirochaetes bacterium GWF1_41_5]|nr:MAG: hypothetical protein A2096_04655 [Spirochaetes bacterium GWF1_41_5]
MIKIDLTKNHEILPANFKTGSVISAAVYRRYSPYRAVINIRGIKLTAEGTIPIPERGRYFVHFENGQLALKLLGRPENIKNSSPPLQSFITAMYLPATEKNIGYLSRMESFFGRDAFIRLVPLLALFLKKNYYPERREIAGLLENKTPDAAALYNAILPRKKKINKKFPGISENIKGIEIFRLVKDDRHTRRINSACNMEVQQYVRQALAFLKSRYIHQHDFLIGRNSTSIMYLYYDWLELSVVKAVIGTKSGDLGIIFSRRKKMLNILFFADETMRINLLYGIEEHAQKAAGLTGFNLQVRFTEPEAGNLAVFGNSFIYSLLTPKTR